MQLYQYVLNVKNVQKGLFIIQCAIEVKLLVNMSEIPIGIMMINFVVGILFVFGIYSAIMVFILRPTVTEEYKERSKRYISLTLRMFIYVIPVTIITSLLLFGSNEWIYYLFGGFAGIPIIKGSLKNQTSKNIIEEGE